MNQWKNVLPGYRTKEVQGKGFRVILHRPELTAEECKRREKAVEQTLALCRGGAK